MGSAGKATYTFTDGNVEQGKTYYYRLQDIDNRGRITAHQIIPVTVAFAKANETPMSSPLTKEDENPPLPPFRKGGMGGFDTSIEDNTMGTPQQTNVASNQDIQEDKYQQPDKPATWMSVVVSDDENKTTVAGKSSTTAPEENAAPAREDHLSDSLQDALQSTYDTLLQSPSSAGSTGKSQSYKVETKPSPSGHSSFSVSIEDDKGNIIMVRRLEDTANTSTPTSDIEISEE